MPILRNPRHEKFAQELAQGKSASEAYVNAGFRASRQNAGRLRTKDDISARVFEIQQAGAQSAEISVASLLAELEEARSKATSLNQLSAAVRATAEKAKISGLLTQKVEMTVNEGPTFDEAQTAEEVLIKTVEYCGIEAAVVLAAAFKLPYAEAAIRALCDGSNSSQRDHTQRVIEWQPPRKTKRAI